MNTQADFNLADGTLAAKESKANIDMNVSADGSLLRRLSCLPLHWMASR